MPRRRPQTLQEAQDEEIARAGGAGGLMGWETRLLRHTKRWTRVLAAVAGMLGAAGTVVGAGVKAWRYIRAGGATAPAELPATGQPTIATDHVERPTPPKP